MNFQKYAVLKPRIYVHGLFGGKFCCSVQDSRSNISVITLVYANFAHHRNFPLTSIAFGIKFASFLQNCGWQIF